MSMFLCRGYVIVNYYDIRRFLNTKQHLWTRSYANKLLLAWFLFWRLPISFRYFKSKCFFPHVFNHDAHNRTYKQLGFTWCCSFVTLLLSTCEPIASKRGNQSTWRSTKLFLLFHFFRDKSSICVVSLIRIGFWVFFAKLIWLFHYPFWNRILQIAPKQYCWNRIYWN